MNDTLEPDLHEPSIQQAFASWGEARPGDAALLERISGDAIGAAGMSAGTTDAAASVLKLGGAIALIGGAVAVFVWSSPTPSVSSSEAPPVVATPAVESDPQPEVAAPEPPPPETPLSVPEPTPEDEEVSDGATGKRKRTEDERLYGGRPALMTRSIAGTGWAAVS